MFYALFFLAVGLGFRYITADDRPHPPTATPGGARSHAGPDEDAADDLLLVYDDGRLVGVTGPAEVTP